jgi:hypothetical protein
MTVREDVVRILQSRGRQEGGTEGAGAVITTRARPAAPVRTVEP